MSKYQLIKTILVIVSMFTLLGCEHSASSKTSIDVEKQENIQSEECIENDFTHSSSPLEPTIAKGCTIDLN